MSDPYSVGGSSRVDLSTGQSVEPQNRSQTGPRPESAELHVSGAGSGSHYGEQSTDMLRHRSAVSEQFTAHTLQRGGMSSGNAQTLQRSMPSHRTGEHHSPHSSTRGSHLLTDGQTAKIQSGSFSSGAGTLAAATAASPDTSGAAGSQVVATVYEGLQKSILILCHRSPQNQQVSLKGWN
jgi:hypothetical protein